MREGERERERGSEEETKASIQLSPLQAATYFRRQVRREDIELASLSLTHSGSRAAAARLDSRRKNTRTHGQTSAHSRHITCVEVQREVQEHVSCHQPHSLALLSLPSPPSASFCLPSLPFLRPSSLASPSAHLTSPPLATASRPAVSRMRMQSAAAHHRPPTSASRTSSTSALSLS